MACAARSIACEWASRYTVYSAGNGTPAGSLGGRTRNGLVVAEVAFPVMLLVGAGLTMRSFLALESVPLGYDPNNVLLMDISLNPKRYPKPEQRNNLFAQIVLRLKALPGVEGVSAGNGGYPFGGPLSAFTIPGKIPTPDRRIHVAFVGDGYLNALRVPLLRGRMISEQETIRADHVAVINQTGANELWPNDDPVGKQISLDLLKNPPPMLAAAGNDPSFTIVGVIGDVKNEGLREVVKPGVLLPYSIIAPPGRTVALRANADPRRLINAIREVVNSVDKDLPIARFITAEESLAFQTVGPRFTMILFAFFAGIGITLAAIGIYSVLSYTVSQRTHEIGIRMALGAEARDVLALVIRSGLRLIAIGIGFGLLASLFLTRLIQAQLFGVTAHDPMSFVAVAVVLVIIVLAACYVPAQRAAKLDPASALQYE